MYDGESQGRTCLTGKRICSPDGHISPHCQRHGQPNGNRVQDLGEVHVDEETNRPGVAKILFTCTEKSDKICNKSINSFAFLIHLKNTNSQINILVNYKQFLIF